MNRPMLVPAILLLLLVVGAGVWYATTATPRSIPPPSPTEPLAPASKDDLIVVTAPLPNTNIQNPVTITGRARGNWYFEASFPAVLYDAHGTVLASMPVQADGEWMTTEYVPFNTTLSFPLPTTPTGTLVLEKDNPSGLPEHANELRIPVRFASYDPNATVQSGTSIKLYYYNPALDQGPGGVQCTDKGVVAVARTIPKTQTPLAAALRLLLQGELTEVERAQGLQTEFPLSGFSLVSATVSDGTATLTFDDPAVTTIGGSCRANILRAQVEATAKQFPAVMNVRIMPGSIFQP